MNALTRMSSGILSVLALGLAVPDGGALRAPEPVEQESPHTSSGHLGFQPSSMLKLWIGDRATRKTVEGHLIDLNCYVEHAGFGDGHRNCARTCARNGLPMGFLDPSGRISLISGPGHQVPQQVNAPLVDLIESTVVLTGVFFEYQDLKLVAVERAVKAPRQISGKQLRSLYKGPAQ